MNRSLNCRASRGFTLIEILIAFAILAVALVALLRAFSEGFAATGRAETVSAAVLLARSTLERVGIDIPLREGSQLGTDDDGGEWTVDIRRSSLVNAAALRGAPVAPYEIRVTASVPNARPIVLTTLRLGPAQQESQ